jgi:hypothetical protein
MGGHASVHQFAAPHREVEFEFAVEFFVDLGRPSRSGKRLRKTMHHVGCSTRDTARAKRAHSCVFAASRFRPSGVIR